MKHRLLHKAQVFPQNWSHDIPLDLSITERIIGDDYDIEDFNNAIESLNTVDIRALFYGCMHAVGSHSIPRIAYQRGGSLHAVFMLQFPDGLKIAAKIPWSHRMPNYRYILSTAATMTMVRCYAKIPAPEVYAWNDDEHNPVGAPYMLLEWIEGPEPWQKWYALEQDERVGLLEELAMYHARFAKKLPFQGIGNIYFSDSLTEVEPDFSSASSYCLGPLTHGPISMVHRENIDLIAEPSLRGLWYKLWKREMDMILGTYGQDRTTIIAREDHPSGMFDQPYTLGQFLDLSAALLALINGCILDPGSNDEYISSSFVNTDYAFRNIKLNPDSLKIQAFIDWDDTYVLPFLLCSRYPEDICCTDGADDSWYVMTGGFAFLPPDEAVAECPVRNTTYTNQDDDDTSDVNGEDYSECDHCSRLTATNLRRQYETLISKYDTRFKQQNFWKMREEPLKIQHIVLKGWTEWVCREEWVVRRAKELDPHLVQCQDCS